jgi:hypothetical protein
LFIPNAPTLNARTTVYAAYPSRDYLALFFGCDDQDFLLAFEGEQGLFDLS